MYMCSQWWVHEGACCTHACIISWEASLRLQHTATHCNTLQRTATHCTTLQHTATHCNTLQHTATHCNTLRHARTHMPIAFTRTNTPSLSLSLSFTHHIHSGGCTAARVVHTDTSSLGKAHYDCCALWTLFLRQSTRL